MYNIYHAMCYTLTQNIGFESFVIAGFEYFFLYTLFCLMKEIISLMRSRESYPGNINGYFVLVKEKHRNDHSCVLYHYLSYKKLNIIVKFIVSGIAN